MIRVPSTDHALYVLACMLNSPAARRVERRGEAMAELKEPVTVRITNPMHRLPTLRSRRLNPWVTLAEFPWLIAGRNDIAWLLPYLPRAKDFSDDGLTWRAGYGPRMRHWGGFDSVTDQLASVVGRLARDKMTRQAVISLWDPETDNEMQSKDYPCTNWLHFQFNPDQDELDLHVVMRSNDLWWGFSGVNVVNFTLLLELVCACLDLEAGSYYHTATNMHLYESRHGTFAQEIVQGGQPRLGQSGAQPFPIAPLVGDTPLSRLHRFTDDCTSALALVEERRQGGMLAMREDMHPWLTQWTRFMLAHGRAMDGDYSTFRDDPWPEDWKLVALMHQAQRGVAV